MGNVEIKLCIKNRHADQPPQAHTLRLTPGPDANLRSHEACVHIHYTSTRVYTRDAYPMNCVEFNAPSWLHNHTIDMYSRRM